MLEDCDHSIEEKLLKTLLSSAILNDTVLKCPVCATSITRSKRFKEVMHKFYGTLIIRKEKMRKTISTFLYEMKRKRSLLFNSSHRNIGKKIYKPTKLIKMSTKCLSLIMFN